MMADVMVTGMVIAAAAVAGWMWGRFGSLGVGEFEGLRGRCGARSVDELPKIEPPDERDMISVGSMAETDPAVRVPLYIAAAMRVAKEQSVGESLARVSAKDAGFEEAMWMAAGYVGACVEYQRLFVQLRSRAEEKERGRSA